jgi:AcrR family transcriptional regulator
LTYGNVRNDVAGVITATKRLTRYVMSTNLPAMKTSPRLLRDTIQHLLPRRHLTTKELERRDLILSAGRTAFVRFGRHGITLSSLALALNLSPSTIRRFFIDLDDLLSQILDQHLLTVARTIAAIPDTDTDHKTKRCEAYLNATRGNLGAYTEDHHLLLRERHRLPPDLLRHIEGLRTAIGEDLGGYFHGEATLAVLDIQGLTHAELLRLVGHIEEPASLAQPEPAPPKSPLPLLEGEEGAQPVTAGKVRAYAEPESKPPAAHDAKRARAVLH